MIPVDAFPLQYPIGWKRTKNPRRAAFSDKTIYRAKNELIAELNRLKAKNIVISCNLVRNLDGDIRSRQAQPEDQGVAVYFELDGQQKCIPCDRWNKIEHNLWSIMKTVEALRGIERWGSKEMMDATFTGFAALPAPRQEINQIDYFFGCQTQEEITERFREKAKELHPDLGGTHEEFAELNRQYQQRKK